MSLLLFADPDHGAHDPGPGMPDRPERIEACMASLERSGLDLEIVVPGPATRTQLERVHRPAYLDRLQAFCAKGGGWIDADTVAGPGSYEVACRAAGACCRAAEAALDGRRSFCLIRPPGHHATSDQAMGFCLVNNIAVAAAHALAGGAEKILILDIDVHHGNGTQEIFWTDGRILYLSLHQWPWYPWTTGGLDETGEGAGEGLNVNVPLPEGCGDEEYERAVETIVFPIARQFGPELIMVSAGFDAHSADHLSLQKVTSGGFGRLAKMISEFADETCRGRLTFCLEGGYNLDALAESVERTVRALAASPSAGRRAAGESTLSRPTGGEDVLAPLVAFHSRRWILHA